MTTTAAVELDEARLGEFVQRFISDMGAAHHSVTVVVGDRLGLYRALADTGPATARDVAVAAGCDERYTQEWLNAQAASGYCEYDPVTGGYHLTPEQTRLLGRRGLTGIPDSGGVLGRGAVQGRGAAHRGDPHRGRRRVGRAPRRSLRRRGTVLPCSVCRQPGAQLDPRARGVEEKLHAGVSVADVGCGHGASTILLAQAYPNSTFLGFDNHVPSIEPPVRRRRGPAWPTGCGSRSRRRRTSRARATHWSASSMRCTTWAIRSARRGMSARPSPMTGHGCSSSRWPATRWPQT